MTLDDATSELYSAFLVEEEGTFSSLRGLAEVIGRHGLFCSLYTDRGSHYFVTPKAGGKVAREQPTQVGRALEQLGIEHIPSYSPEARGRMERVFGTLQNRLPQELRLAGDHGRSAAANRFLAEAFVADHNARFAVAAAEPGSAFVPYAGDLAEVLCLQVERVVGNDNCVRYEGRCLQIPPHRHRHHFVKVKVRVHAYEDGRLAVFHGPRCLARYQPDGHLADVEADDQTRRLKPARRHARWTCWTTLRVAHNPTGPTAAADIQISRPSGDPARYVGGTAATTIACRPRPALAARRAALSTSPPARRRRAGGMARALAMDRTPRRPGARRGLVSLSRAASTGPAGSVPGLSP